MRVLVCGGRDYDDRRVVARALSPYKTPINSKPEHVIICGLAPGADTLALEWGRVFGVPVVGFSADWKANGRAAGPMRNAKMIEEGKPDIVIAFPGGRGTADMVRRARAALIRVIEVA